MSDSCKHCVARGDVALCDATPCNTHDSWYARRLKAELAGERERVERLRAALAGARDVVADEVQHALHSYGDCSLTRCMRAELAEIDAVLKDTQN